MMEILGYVNRACGYLFYLCYILLFYVSLKKCFWREGYSKVRLFFLSLLTNPVLLLTASVVPSFLLVFLRGVSKTDPGMQDYSYLATDRFYSSLIVLIASMIFVVLIMPVSYLMGRSLKAYNRSLVMFVYIMFSVIIVLADNQRSEIPEGAGSVIGILYNI